LFGAIILSSPLAVCCARVLYFSCTRIFGARFTIPVDGTLDLLCRKLAEFGRTHCLGVRSPTEDPIDGFREAIDLSDDLDRAVGQLRQCLIGHQGILANKSGLLCCNSDDDY
jgi:hypothetical protein